MLMSAKTGKKSNDGLVDAWHKPEIVIEMDYIAFDQQREIAS